MVFFLKENLKLNRVASVQPKAGKEIGARLGRTIINHISVVLWLRRSPGAGPNRNARPTQPELWGARQTVVSVPPSHCGWVSGLERCR